MFDKLSFIRQYLSFVLTLLGMIASTTLAFNGKADATVLLPTLLAIYIGGRTSEKMSAHWAASKDVDADTELVIQQVTDK